MATYDITMFGSVEYDSATKEAISRTFQLSLLQPLPESTLRMLLGYYNQFRPTVTTASQMLNAIWAAMPSVMDVNKTQLAAFVNAIFKNVEPGIEVQNPKERPSFSEVAQTDLKVIKQTATAAKDAVASALPWGKIFLGAAALGALYVFLPRLASAGASAYGSYRKSRK